MCHLLTNLWVNLANHFSGWNNKCSMEWNCAQTAWISNKRPENIIAYKLEFSRGFRYVASFGSAMQNRSEIMQAIATMKPCISKCKWKKRGGLFRLLSQSALALQVVQRIREWLAAACRPPRRKGVSLAASYQHFSINTLSTQYSATMVNVDDLRNKKDRFTLHFGGRQLDFRRLSSSRK